MWLAGPQLLLQLVLLWLLQPKHMFLLHVSDSCSMSNGFWLPAESEAAAERPLLWTKQAGGRAGGQAGSRCSLHYCGGGFDIRLQDIAMLAAASAAVAGCHRKQTRDA